MKQHLEVSLLVSFLEPKIDITLVLAELGVKSERFLSLPDVLVTTHHSGQWQQLIRYMIFAGDICIDIHYFRGCLGSYSFPV